MDQKLVAELERINQLAHDLFGAIRSAQDLASAAGLDRADHEDLWLGLSELGELDLERAQDISAQIIGELADPEPV